MKNFKSATLGSTGIKVGRIGIGSSYGVKAADIEWAVDQGVTYLYWGSSRRRGMRDAIRAIGKRDRGRIQVVVQSYSRSGILMDHSVNIALRALKTDYADLLLLGWWNHLPPNRIMDQAHKLVEKGRVKHLAISTHHRPFGKRILDEGLCDVLHIRYNAAHRGAEKELFNGLPAKRPGIVTYTTTRWGTLLKRPKSLAKDVPVPTSTDCYRFALTNQNSDVVMSGPANRTELEMALAALDKGPMNAEELAWMKKVGDVVHREAPKPSIFMMGVSALDLRKGTSPL